MSMNIINFTNNNAHTCTPHHWSDMGIGTFEGANSQVKSDITKQFCVYFCQMSSVVGLVGQGPLLTDLME